jgi:hypothetical protein
MKNVYRGFVILFLVLLMMTVITVPALAFNGRGGNNVTITSEEVIEGDLYLSGGNLIINGTVNGDVFGAGQSFTINGNVNGGITLAAQTITINGNIASGARVAGQYVTLNGNIGRDLVAAGATVTISPQSEIMADLVLAAATALIEGNVHRNITGSAGTATIAGEVGGNIDLEVDQLTLTPNANIQGNLVYESANNADIQAGATVGGTTTRNMPETTTRDYRAYLPALAGVAVLWKVMGFLMILLTGIILILIAPHRTGLMANAIKHHPWQSLGWGALILLATPIAAFIVMFTIIGIPLSLIALVLYAIAIYISQIPVGLIIGQLIIRQNRELESRGIMIGALALGLFLLFLVTLIPIFGWIVSLLIIVFGLGTLVTSNRRVEAREVL